MSPQKLSKGQIGSSPVKATKQGLQVFLDQHSYTCRLLRIFQSLFKGDRVDNSHMLNECEIGASLSSTSKVIHRKFSREIKLHVHEIGAYKLYRLHFPGNFD